MATPWGNARKAFYDPIFLGYPSHYYDGLFDAWPYTTYESKFLARQAEPTDVTIALSAIQTSGATFEVVTEICIEPGGVGKTMSVFLVQSLSHYPLLRSYARNTVMQGLDFVNVTVAAGACETVVRDITFDTVSWGLSDRIQLTAWAQQPATVAPGEVYQAKQVQWPFFIAALFADGFEDGSTGAWTTTSP